MVNYIIQHSKGSLNISDRTKLALMDEEELINKALKLGISLKGLNDYTKPGLISTVSDIYNSSLLINICSGPRPTSYVFVISSVSIFI